jgi:hypothetical protein
VESQKERATAIRMAVALSSLRKMLKFGLRNLGAQAL